LFICVVFGEYNVPYHARGGLFPHDVKPQDNLIFNQVLDHFGEDNSTTFPQRYFVYLPSKTIAGNPVFLDICGEGPCGGSSGYSKYLTDEYQGVAFALEHRFYGKSVPNNDFSVENLKYLTVEQSLADLANFIDNVIRVQYPVSPIIAIGGSYSGGVSSWFRYVYPNHTCAALSSSGVVHAIFDFHQFDSRVRIAAGVECANQIINARKAMEDMWTSDRDKLKSIFGLSSDSLQDPGDFFYMVADSSAMAVQYGMKEIFCSGIIPVDPDDHEALIETYSNLTMKIWGDDFPSMCFYDTQCLINDKDKWQPTSRGWRWQKCSQLAYFQSFPGSKSLRSNYVSMDYVKKQCVSIFGNTILDTDDFNQKYGGNMPFATKVYYSDFSDDPWQEASISRSLPDQPFGYVECDGCGHCRDLHTPSKNDPQPVKDGRKDFEFFLDLWIQECSQ